MQLVSGSSNGGAPVALAGSSDARKLFVGGLAQSMNCEVLQAYFARFGPVTEVDVKNDPQTGRSRGFGFVTFADPSCVELALTASHQIDGSCIEAKRVERPAPAPTEEPRRCRHFSNGRCSFGSHCRFVHDMEPQLAAPLTRPVDEDVPSFAVDALGAVLGMLTGGQAPESLVAPALSAIVSLVGGSVPAPVVADLLGKVCIPTTEAGACRHYLQGRCNFGDTCRFPHVGGPEGAPQGHPKAKTVFLGGLPRTLAEETLMQHLSRFGTVRNLEIKRTGDGVSRGFGFADFVEDGAADAVLAVPNAHVLEGRTIEVRRHFGSAGPPPPSAVASAPPPAALRLPTTPLDDVGALARALGILLGSSAALGALPLSPEEQQTTPQNMISELAQEVASVLSQQVLANQLAVNQRLQESGGSYGMVLDQRLQAPGGAYGLVANQQLQEPGGTYGLVASQRLQEPGGVPGVVTSQRLQEPGGSYGVAANQKLQEPGGSYGLAAAPRSGFHVAPY